MKNIYKKIIGFLITISLGRSFFGIQNPANIAHAQAETTTTTNTATDTTSTKTNGTEKMTLLQIIDLLLKLVYILIRPILVLAGVALDNTLVYGSFLHMDAPLWQFWNITKNFANFALGFLVLIEIIKNIFSAGGNKNVMGTIKKTLIAGILIQASWFLLAAVIDLSTVATYTIGGMPMSILKTSEHTTNKKLFMTESSLDLNNLDKIGVKEFKVRYKTKTKEGNEDILISPCKTKSLNGNDYIVGREFGDSKFKNLKANEKLGETGKIRDELEPTRNICIYRANDVYFFNEFPNIRDKEGSDYEYQLDKNINLLGGETSTLEACGFIVNINKGVTSTESCETKIGELEKSETIDKIAGAKELIGELKGSGKLPKGIIRDYNYDQTTYRDGYGFGSGWINETAATTVGELIDKSKGFVGPLVTIYSSLMDFSNLSDTSIAKESISKGIGELIIRTGVAVGLFFPLLALAIVLFARIGFLWAVIAASPLVVLAEVFDRGKSSALKDLSKHISLGNILNTIFAPVITVFALSISLIFMTTLIDMFQPNSVSKTDVLQNFGVEVVDTTNTTETVSFLGSTVQYPKSIGTYAGATGDWFSWLIICLSGIGVMWFIVFAAIKASGTIGASIGKSVENFGTNFMKTMPIVPIGGGIGFSTLTDKIKSSNAIDYWNNNIVDTKGQTRRLETDLEDRFGSLVKPNNSDESFSEREANQMIEYLKQGDGNSALRYMEGRDMKIKDENGNINNSAVYDIMKNNNLLEKINKEQKDKVLQEMGIADIHTTQEFTTNASKIKTKEDLDRFVSDNKEIAKKLPANHTVEVSIKEGNETKIYTISKDASGSLIQTEKK